MSSKSKRRPHRQSATDLGNRFLLLFVWAWVNVCHPTVGEILAVKKEILNVSESMRQGLVNERMIAEQLRDEYGLATDWARRDRQ